MAKFFCVLGRVSVLARIAALAAMVFGFAATVSLAAASPSEKRVALVIGNGAYQNAVRLDNAVFDARAVADAFRELGFQVVDGYDLDIDQMRAKVSEFSAALSDSKSAVIYYAGHGVSVDEENYLVPTDIALKSPTDLDLNAIGVSLLLKQMKREDRVNIVILDACRDNPFAAELAKRKTRALVVERGLSRIDGDLARGTLIAFASDPKSTALDGPPGQHSPFTAAFLAHLDDPGVPIDTVMSRVRNDVWEKTGHHQLPWVNTSLIGEYELNPQPPPESTAETTKPSAPPAETVAGPRQAEENLLWESAQHSNLAADYQAYLSAFPGGVFAQMAKNRIASMEAARASAPPAPQPQSLAMTEPTGPQENEGKNDIGTVETERALNLSAAGEKEVQHRLAVLDLYKGPVTGALDQATRSALAEWQKKREFAPTSFLDSAQLAALRADSETEYQKSLAAQPATQPAAPEAPRRALARPSPKPPVMRAAKPPAPATPARRVVKRTNPSRPETAYQAPPPPPVFLGGSPAWRHKAGLPELPTDPGMGGRPPGFWLGSSGGLLLGGH
jgi:peptidoglycan hydrolase-like protein with peptidoglycan-binding domain